MTAEILPSISLRAARICGISSACIGGLGLAGWILDSRVLTGVRMEYIPIAPNTALIIILLGIALFSVTRWPGHRGIRMAITGLVSFCVLLAGLTLAGILTGLDLKIDDLFISTRGILGSSPVGHMSPVTAACFLVGCAAILLLLKKKNDPAAILGTVITLIAGVILIGYWYGAPLLYGGSFIPVALPTAIALGILGTGLIAAAGPASWPLSGISDGSTRSKLLRGLLPVIFIVILIVNWITVFILGTASSTVVLAATVMVLVSLLVMYLVVSYLSREIGDTIDNAERERKRADEALQLKTTDLEAAFEEITATEEELRANYEELATIQRSLKENERKYRNLYTYAQVGLFETSFRDATVITCNERYALLAGYSSVEEAIGSDILPHYVNPEDRTEVGRILREQGHIDNYVLKLRNHTTGKIFWTQFSARFNYEREVAEGSIIDITAQKVAESALQKSEDAFRSLAENANDGFLVGAVNGMHVFANKRAADITGYSIDELVHTSIRDLVRPDEFERVVQDRFRKRMAGEPAPNQYETILVGKDGLDVPIELSSSKIAWYGAPADLIVFRDITERRRIMDTLRENEQRLHEAQEMAHLGYWSWDIRSGAVTWSDEVFKIFGLDPATFTPQIDSILALSPWPADHERNHELIRRAMESREPGTYEQRFLRPDKSTGYYHSTFQGRYDESGDLITIVGTVLDITDHKKAEEQTRISELRYRRLFESAKDGILILNRDTGAIIDANPFIETLLGYSPNDLVGKHLWEIGLFKDQILSKIAFDELQTKEYLRYEDLPLETKDGQKKEVEFVSNVYPVDPDTSVIQCNIRDITERKRAEQQREAMIKELEQKNAELEQFTYTVSHDLKSPLITIKGFAGLLEEDARSGNPEQLTRDILRISTAADTMQALLNDVLELSRVGRVISPPSRTPFGTIAKEAVELLAGPLAERGVAVEIAPDLPVVNVDRARIREVMVNIIENAVKFMGDEPHPHIRISAETGGEMPVFSVRDNGIGIDPKYLNRIFNLFEKLTPSMPGTGIGLPIIRRIIEVHGGKIWAESEGPGMGTTIRFTLPAAHGDPDKHD